MAEPVQLDTIAQKIMIERGFLPEFPEAVLQELSSLQAPAQGKQSAPFKDMRDQLWVSIDNEDTQDIDQLTFAKVSSTGQDTIYIAIADVDALVKKDSALDRYAFHNCTSVYTPTKVFPMLPLKLSTDLTSLSEHAERLAIVVEIAVDKEGAFSLIDIYPSIVCNRAKLNYPGVTAHLEKQEPLPPHIKNQQALSEQLRLQDTIAQKIKKWRTSQGSLNFFMPEFQPIIVDGKAIRLEERPYTRAHELIENYMIAANSSATLYLDKKKFPVLRRVVETPKRWDRIAMLARNFQEKLPPTPNIQSLHAFLLHQQQLDPVRFPDLFLSIIKLIGRGEYRVGFPDESPIGHFDLALTDYTHMTAPNRRYADLVTGRLLKCCFDTAANPYSKETLQTIAQQCTQKEDDALKVERRMRKSTAAMVLVDRVGQIFDAIVTGAGEKGVWVRLFSPRVEGKLIHGFNGLDTGDYLSVKLVYVDIANGYIDFIRHR